MEKLIIKRLLVGPSTAREIQMSLYRRTIDQYLIKLEKEGVVERVGKVREHKLGNPATIWGLVNQVDGKALR